MPEHRIKMAGMDGIENVAKALEEAGKMMQARADNLDGLVANVKAAGKKLDEAARQLRGPGFGLAMREKIRRLDMAQR